MKNYITARICGNEHVCKIHREDLPYFEEAHGSAYDLLKRIMASQWTAKDLHAVIEFSLATRPGRDHEPWLWAARHKGFASFSRAGVTPVSLRAFVANGPAHYVPLAVSILVAALSGVPDEDATFSDEEGADG